MPDILQPDFEETRPHHEVTWVAFSKDSGLIFSTSPDLRYISPPTISIWSTIGRKLLLTLEGHTNALTGIALSPDGRLLITTCADQAVRIWGVWPCGRRFIIRIKT